MLYGYFHLELYETLYTYPGVRTSLPITFSPLLSHTIFNEIIDYNRNYYGGSSDLPGFVLSQSCI